MYYLLCIVPSASYAARLVPINLQSFFWWRHYFLVARRTHAERLARLDAVNPTAGVACFLETGGRQDKQRGRGELGRGELKQRSVRPTDIPTDWHVDTEEEKRSGSWGGGRSTESVPVLLGRVVSARLAPCATRAVGVLTQTVRPGLGLLHLFGVGIGLGGRRDETTSTGRSLQAKS